MNTGASQGHVLLGLVVFQSFLSLVPENTTGPETGPVKLVGLHTSVQLSGLKDGRCSSMKVPYTCCLCVPYLLSKDSVTWLFILRPEASVSSVLPLFRVNF